ncbi:MAG: MFS transporter [Rhizobiaceae bacterium]|nr:MFS transporter [Rhizobiaceae bacterium]
MNAPSTRSEARRTAFILATAQAIMGSVPPICISVGALVGSQLLDADKSLATAPVTGFNLGVALGALPAAALIRRFGQRNGFMSGAGVVGIGGMIATLAMLRGSFWLFAMGVCLVGMGMSFSQQYRFAAADDAGPAFKARAISWVMAGGVLNGILGPQVVIFTDDLMAPVKFAGSFASILVIAGIGAAVLSLLRLKPKMQVVAEASHEPVRPLLEVIRQPQFAVGLLCAVGSYSLMSFVMTGAPLAMIGCGFSSDEAALGISWHVLAMFGPSFFTGLLIARFGKERILATGLLLLIGCGVCALAGIELWNFWLALILLGLGWNFGFIGATAMVAGTYRFSEKGKVQGFHDFVLFGFVAFSSLMSGIIFNAYGWDALAMVIFPVTLLCLVALGMVVVLARGQKAESPA